MNKAVKGTSVNTDLMSRFNSRRTSMETATRNNFNEYSRKYIFPLSNTYIETHVPIAVRIKATNMNPVRKQHNCLNIE
jgi:hypothetical protein